MMSRLDQLRVDLLLQYTLVRAAQEDDWRDRADDWLQWLVTDTFPTDSVLPTIREEFAKLP